MTTKTTEAPVELKDRKRICKKCKEGFIFEKGEQKFFLKKLLSAPNICPKCRQAKKEQKERNQEEKKRFDLAKSYGANVPTVSFAKMTEYVKIKIVNLSLNRGLQHELEKKTEREKER